ncbi:MAG: spoIIAA [Haloplasmataceae bacterium]|jgi:stage II sporulation protein AA (anti-sigma F factor antagonist)|nr:spoIIAA [Haloplasmataceae bacterium]
MSLSVHFFLKSDTLFIRLSGELDHHSSSQLRERINTLMEQYEIKNIVFNFKNLSFMDSSGIGVMLGRYNQVKKNKGLLLACDLNGSIEKIIKLSGLYKILVITKDEEQASNYLGVA